MKYKPRTVEATQFMNNDQPQAECAIVSPFRHPAIPDSAVCSLCQLAYRDHGRIDLGGGGLMVCPGDYVVTANGVTRAVKPDVFERDYEPVGAEG